MVFGLKIASALCLVLLFSGDLLYGQAPSVLWNNCLGGSGHEDAQSVIESRRGEIISVGHTHSSDQQVSGYVDWGDLWVACMNSEGALLWQKCYGGSLFDEAKSIIETRDGNYVLAGFSESSDYDLVVNKGIRDVWVMKIDSVGNLLWNTPVGSSGMDMAYDVVETSDSGFLAVGFSEYADGDVAQNQGFYDAWVVRLDASGQFLWEKSYGGSADDYARSVIQTPDGGFLIAGETASADGDVFENKGYSDAWIIKLDAGGNLIWEKTFGGSQNDVFYSVVSAGAGRYIASGETRSDDGDALENHGYKDAFVICFDSLGEVVWKKCYGGGYLDLVSSSCSTLDGSFVFAGITGSTDGDVSGLIGLYDLWIMALDSAGTLLWQGCYGDTLLDWGASVFNTVDGGFVAAGQTLYSQTSLTGNHGAEDTWVIRLSNSTDVPKNATLIPKTVIYPNPANTSLTIEASASAIYSLAMNREAYYQIIDLQGRIMMQGLLNAGNPTLNIRALSEGLYVLKTSAGVGRFEVVR